jgi:hypothetical protein
MAQLSSPGVSVTVIDESFYTPAAPGTVPLIIVASAESKQNGAGTGTAPGTLKANAGNVYLLTSQKDLSDTFGTPVFKTDASNNPVHAGEQNEYGLQAAYSYLGVSNRAYVVRADIDLGMLDAKSSAPKGSPTDGTFWLDTGNTQFGIFEWNAAAATVAGGQTFSLKTPIVITDSTKTTTDPIPAPLVSIGAIGAYAVVATTNLVTLWYKKDVTDSAAGTWVEVGTTAWAKSRPTIAGTTSNPTFSSNTLTINTVSVTLTSVTTLTGLVSAINGTSGVTTLGITAAAVNSTLQLYSTGVDIAISGTACTPAGVTAGTYKAPASTISAHTSVPTYKIADNLSTVNGYPTGSLWIKITNPNYGADWVVKRYNAVTGQWVIQKAPIYSNGYTALYNLDPKGGGINLAKETIYVKSNNSEVTPGIPDFKVYIRRAAGAMSITSAPITTSTFTAGTNTFTVSESGIGSSTLTSPVTVSFSPDNSTAAHDYNALLTAFNTALSGTLLTAVLNADYSITITHTAGGSIYFTDGTNTPLSKLFSTSTTANYYASSDGVATHYTATLWQPINTYNTAYVQSDTAPSTNPADGQLWYSSIVDEVDIMVHNGTTWVGYLNYTQNGAGGTTCDPAGPIVSATKPTLQSDGTALANGDLWIDTSDIENYPMLYKYDYANQKWRSVDTADQTTENGIVFHDARWNITGTGSTASTIKDLLSSNFLDFDAPDPALYPKGMLLWNLRRSGFNVKEYMRGYVDTTARNPRQSNTLMSSYYPDRWVSVAANQENGAGTFGRHAQRKVVVQALQALVNSNQQIRDEESRVFNLMACPGYPELVGEMIGLNYDRGITAFVVADTPARLTPDATSLSNWGFNVNLALEDNDTGLVSFDEYVGFFYPWGYTSDNIGNNVVVPPSHMMLRTIALNDNVSYPWFAPAGTRRGGITNATAVGYITMEGEFQSVALNGGQRDTLASVKVNPLTFITGTGLVNYGQYTRAKNASALDRINVARLVIYLRRQFAQLAKPYIFEPNDKITRDEIKQAAENLLLELVGQRALYDYLVVCDTSNNTPARIDRSELYLDVAIEPVKAVEFIYIPLRLKNTGEIAGLGK